MDFNFQNINVGVSPGGQGDGDLVREAFIKVNENFDSIKLKFEDFDPIANQFLVGNSDGTAWEKRGLVGQDMNINTVTGARIPVWTSTSQTWRENGYVVGDTVTGSTIALRDTQGRLKATEAVDGTQVVNLNQLNSNLNNYIIKPIEGVNGQVLTTNGAGLYTWQSLPSKSIDPQEEWLPASAPEANSWSSIAYGNGKFVAIASGGSGTNRAMYSSDGITWNSASPAQNNSWLGVTYGNGKFVAVSQNGTNRVMYSLDGIIWNTATAAQNNTWRSITYGNGKFVAVASNGANRVMYSTDGITWLPASATEPNGWQSVTYGGGKFVAVANTGINRVMYSTDGINWLPASATEPNGWQSVTYGNGKFVAVASNGANRVMYSFDGITWTSANAAVNIYWREVTYGNGKFVAVSQDATNSIMYSLDGIIWNSASPTEPNIWTSVTYGNGKFVAVSQSGTNRVMYSFNELKTSELINDGDGDSPFITEAEANFIPLSGTEVGKPLTGEIEVDTSNGSVGFYSDSGGIERRIAMTDNGGNSMSITSNNLSTIYEQTQNIMGFVAVDYNTYENSRILITPKSTTIATEDTDGNIAEIVVGDYGTVRFNSDIPGDGLSGYMDYNHDEGLRIIDNNSNDFANLAFYGISGYNNNQWHIEKNHSDVSPSILQLPDSGTTQRRIPVSVNGNYANQQGDISITNLTPNGTDNLIDVDNKLNPVYLPPNIMHLQGEWNADTNTPTLSNGTGVAGYIYEVTTAGTTDFGDGDIEFALGDWVVYGGDGKWYKSPNTGEVVGVKGDNEVAYRKGLVNLTTADVISNNSVSNAMLANMGNNTFKGRPGNAGVATDIPVPVNRLVGRGSTGTLGVLTVGPALTFTGSELNVTPGIYVPLSEVTSIATPNKVVQYSNTGNVNTSLAEFPENAVPLFQLNAMLGNYVTITGNQTIAGVKTFSSSPIVPIATTATQAVNKGQLEGMLNDNIYSVNQISLVDNQVIDIPDSAISTLYSLDTLTNDITIYLPHPNLHKNKKIKFFDGNFLIHLAVENNLVDKMLDEYMTPKTMFHYVGRFTAESDGVYWIISNINQAG